jgi:HEAT repeat protein
MLTMEAARSPEAHPAAETGAEPITPLARAVRTGSASAVRDVLEASPLTADQVEPAIDLLAWNDVAPYAIRALSQVAGSNVPILLRHLLDPDEDFAIRRRLVNTLASCRSAEAFYGLFEALNDRRFEVRYRAGRALSTMVEQIPGLQVEPQRVMAVVEREMAVERGIWESRQLIDADEETSPMESELIRDRASRSLEHLFTLLSLILPRQTLRLAFHALHTDDPQLRGTALEYLETVLPEPIWNRLRVLLEAGEGQTRVRSAPGQAVRDLLASRETIGLALAEARRRQRASPSSTD